MRRQALVAALMAAGCVGVPATAVGQTPTPTPTPQPGANKFEKVTLNDFPGEPMNLAVLPDGRVLHTARTGEIRIHDPKTGGNLMAARLDVYQHDEEGLQSVAINPRTFKKDKWVYAYYSPPLDTPADNPATPGFNEGDAPDNGTPADWQRFKGVIRLSRFKLKGNKLSLKTEQKILDVPVDRGQCCHVGGNIEFDAKGNLYLSTGDDTNPFFSDGFTPIDDSAGRNPVFDARRSAGNTNDLRGKILRIKPKKNKPGYVVPKGNLFRKGQAKTKPEVYAMGLRNPYRFGIDPESGDLYVGDYSPDADKPDPDRGPAGHGRWIIIKKPANYGWPYCVTPKLAYNDYDFATKVSGPKFNCKAPRNDSAYNTGLKTLPPVARPDVWYSYILSPHFPALEVEGPEGNGGIAPMGGPAYVPKRGNKSPLRFPNRYAGKPLFYEWSRDYIKLMELDKRGRLDEIQSFAPFVDNPMDIEWGPDGTMYVLEYGDGYFAENPDAQLSKINYVRGNRSPVPKIAATPAGGAAPLTVQFSTAGTTDPDGDKLSYAWDFDGDGKTDSRSPNPSHTYTKEGEFRPVVKVTDKTKRTASADVEILVGNQQPELELVTTPKPDDPAAPFQFGQTITYEVKITDDQPVDCSKVTVAYILGHERHGHPQSSTAGCSGQIVTPVDSGHAGAANLSAILGASYTDPGGLNGTAEVRFTPPAPPHGGN
jgi:cytochrome c